MKYSYLIIPAIFFIFSCSSMKVKVDILNRDAFIKSPEYLGYSSERNILNAQSKSVDITNRIKDLQDTLPSVLEAQVLPQLASIPINSYSTYKGILRREIELIKNKFHESVSLTQLNYRGQFELIDPLAELSRDVNELSNTLTRVFTQEGAFIAVAQADSTSNANSVSELMESVFKPLIVAANLNEIELKADNVDNLLGDPIASFVAHSDRKIYWEDFGGKYNLTEVKTKFGNSDIAVSMNGPGEYTIKGVRMDPSDAIKAGFKSLKSGISILAASQGVPLQMNSSENSNTPIINYSLATDSTNQKITEVEQRFTENALRLLKVISAQSENIKSADQNIEFASITAIKSQIKKLDTKENAVSNQ
ncbi:MAG: hypothetical protein HEP71_22290 [Roseivirga sp.]|nr:hypothetical protein [Roseivirga sp.]